MLDAADCFQCTTFDFLHGYYRSALANLRSALELVLIGAYGNIDPRSEDYLDWKNSASDMRFTSVRRRLFACLKGAPAGRWLLDEDKPLANIFRDLCRFTHSRPNATDGALWQSNGPVYNNAAIKLVFDTSLRVYAICYLLIRIVRPTFTLPEHSHILFELDWLQDHEQFLRAFREFNDRDGHSAAGP